MLLKKKSLDLNVAKAGSQDMSQYNSRSTGGVNVNEKEHLTLRLLMSYIYIYIYIYGAPILDVSRSHTTTQHSR